MNQQSNMDDNGMVYIPNACTTGGCKVHVALHGCLMGMDHPSISDGYIYGDNFAVDTGYLNYASSNNVIVLLPQIETTFPLNSWGCWDFNGTTGPNYNNNLGV